MSWKSKRFIMQKVASVQSPLVITQPPMQSLSNLVIKIVWDTKLVEVSVTKGVSIQPINRFTQRPGCQKVVEFTTKSELSRQPLLKTFYWT